ncbi:hypothetical protein R6Q57_012859 [Mikania cordata]
MWKVYLDLKEYAAALANCSDPYQRDQVYLEQGNGNGNRNGNRRNKKRRWWESRERESSERNRLCIITNQHTESTRRITVLKDLAAGINGTCRTFQIAIPERLESLANSTPRSNSLFRDLLMQAEAAFSVGDFFRAALFFAKDALRTFLLRKLDNLVKDDTFQIIMISKWATELTLTSYDRIDELVYFVDLKEQYKIVIHHYIQQGEAKRALDVLQKLGVSVDLQIDPELAMPEADKVEDDEDLRKKLWLMVAKHVEQEKGTKRENIRKAIAFLKETDGLLKIEDILPFFPDFALIDDFKVIVVTS